MGAFTGVAARQTGRHLPAIFTRHHRHYINERAVMLTGNT